MWLCVTRKVLLIFILYSGWGGGGIQTSVILFVSEIANDDIRGRLGSIILFLRHIGILIAFVLGATVEYRHIPYICIIIPFIFAIFFFMLPNTPQYLLHKGQTQVSDPNQF